MFESGARLPVKVDAVMETVGKATWSHSIRALRPGGRIVTSGTTSGPNLDDAELTRIFFLQLSVIGSTMGTRDELASLVALLDATGARPLIDRTIPMTEARDGLRRDARRRAVRQDRVHPLMATHLLTGAGSGIGAVVAERLHARGDRLVLIARSQERSAELAERFPGALALVADLAWPESVESLALPDALDSVVHSAGDRRARAGRRPVDRRLGDPAPRQPGRAGRADPGGAARAACGARHRRLRELRRRPQRATRGWSAYAASKHGLRALADSLRGEEPDGSASPRSTRAAPATPMQEKVHEQEGKEYDAAAWIRPETVADAILHVLDLPRDATMTDVTVRPR